MGQISLQDLHNLSKDVGVELSQQAGYFEWVSETPVMPHVKELMCNKQKTAGGFNVHLKHQSDVREIRQKERAHSGSFGQNGLKCLWRLVANITELQFKWEQFADSVSS